MAKTKKKNILDENEEIMGGLNPEQERFCRLYASDKEFFGSGIESYIEAYDPDQSNPNWKNSAYACASRLLKRAKIIKRINELLELTGFNEVSVDKELHFLITQHADFPSKIAAIREFNKLKKRISDISPVTIVMPTPIFGGSSNKPNERTTDKK